MMTERRRVAVVFTGGPSLKEINPTAVISSFDVPPLVVTIKGAYDYVHTPVDLHFFNDTNLRKAEKRNRKTKFIFVSNRSLSWVFVRHDVFLKVRRRRIGQRYMTALDANRFDWLEIGQGRVVSGPGIMHTAVLPWILREGIEEIHIYGWDNIKRPKFGGHFGLSDVDRPPKRCPFLGEAQLRSLLKPLGEALLLVPNVLRYKRGELIFRRTPPEGEYSTIHGSRQATVDWLASKGVSLRIH